MIGVIGSADSVELTLLVARDIGLADQVIGRAYRHVDQAPDIAHDLDRVCRSLLFTGRVPFSRAVTDPDVLAATVDFVPHTAIDLYRTLAVVLRAHGGALPEISIDTIDEEIVAEVFHDLDLPAKFRVLSLDKGRGGLRSGEEVVRFHLAAQRGDHAGLSLTCLGSVSEALRAAGAPVIRIEHTRSTLRQALTSAATSARMAEIEGSQAAVAVLRPLDGRRRRAVPPHVRSYAERLGGVTRAGSQTTWTVHTTFGSVQALVRSGPTDMPLGWSVGFGVGASVSQAEVNAHRALALTQGVGLPLTVLADGSVIGGDTRGLAGYRFRETDQELLAHARDVGLRSLTVARLAAALRRLDPSSVTARDLAGAYGVEVRSARRMLRDLERLGIASAAGAEGPPRAGRPQTVYRIDVDQLLPRR